jgi:hypothetical protein
MKTDALVAGKQYYFYELHPNRPETVYRATYLAVFTNAVLSYLIKKRFDPVTNQNVLHYSPLHWFYKAELLEDVLEKMCLPTDTIRIIESYL